jgi:hypothetical protein
LRRSERGWPIPPASQRRGGRRREDPLGRGPERDVWGGADNEQTRLTGGTAHSSLDHFASVLLGGDGGRGVRVSSV